MALCATQRQWLSLAGWLSWIINFDRPYVEGHPEQHNRLNLSLCCLRATCQARSTLIMQLVSGVAGLSASYDISRGSVATHLRCGGIYSDSFITNCLLVLTVKEFWKSVNIWWSYEAYNKWCHFWPTLYVSTRQRHDARRTWDMFVNHMHDLFSEIYQYITNDNTTRHLGNPKLFGKLRVA